MKRHFLPMGLILGATLSLISCGTEEFKSSGNAQNVFSIRLSADELSRNANDGMSTKWVAGDGITVWHAEAGTTNFVKDSQFTTTDAGSTATFTGTVDASFNPEAAYDWYVIYPYKSQLPSPVGVEGNFTGNQSVGKPYAQQNGLSSSAHLNGADYAIYGKVSNVVGNTVPDVQMKHVCSLVKVHVTNNSSAPIRPNTIVFTAPEQECIVGNQSIDYTSEPMKFWANPSNASKSAWLDVAGTPVLASGESADFYFAVKPFTAATGETLKIGVNGYEKTVVLEKEKKFEPGKVKTIEFNYDLNTDYSGDYAIVCEATDGKTYMAEALAFPCINMEIVSGGTNPVLFSKPVRIDGKTIFHDANMVIGPCDTDATIENFKFTFTKVSEGDYAGMYTIQNAAGKYLATIASNSNSSAFQDAADVNSYFDIGITADGKLYLCATKSSNNRAFKFNFNNGFLPRYIDCAYTNTSLIPSALSLKDYTFEIDTTPRIKADDIQGVSASGVTDQSFTLAIENNEAGWTPEISGYRGCVSAASIFGDIVTYSVSANTSSDPATGAIVVKLSDPEGKLADVTATINVIQNGKTSVYFTKVSANKTDWAGSYILVSEDGTKAHIMYTSEPNYSDGAQTTGGSPSFEVDLEKDGIAATEAVMKNILEVRAHSYDGGTGSNLVYNGEAQEGKYTFFINIMGPTLGGKKGWGLWGRDPAKQMMPNNNEYHSRFAMTMEYDTESGSLHCICTASNGSPAYLRYETITKSFGWKNSFVVGAGTINNGGIAADFADVQLYEIVAK